MVVGDRLTEWIGTRTDIESEVRARTRLELLARATEAMNRDYGPVQELQALAEVLVPTFADGCTIHLIDPMMPDGPLTGRQLLSRVTFDVPEATATQRVFSYTGDHPFVELLRTGRPILLQHPLQTDARWARDADLADWERTLGWHTSLLTPIRVGGSVIAVLTFVAWGDRPPFVDEDLTFVRELGGQGLGGRRARPALPGHPSGRADPAAGDAHRATRTRRRADRGPLPTRAGRSLRSAATGTTPSPCPAATSPWSSATWWGTTCAPPP